MKISFNINLANNFLNEQNLKQLTPFVESHHKQLIKKSGKGNNFLGWLQLPSTMLNDKKIIERSDNIKKLWENKNITHIVVVGIGGSYLGARAIYEALTGNFHETSPKSPKLIFAGHNMSSKYLNDLTKYLSDKDFGIIVISKSGTTLEPALAFRLLKTTLEEKHSMTEVSQRIIAITDSEKGALRNFANTECYESFDIADDIGGRYSVLSPVGIIPLALTGINILELLKGGEVAQNHFIENASIDGNIALKYAAVRHILYSQDKSIEMLVSFCPELFYFIEWWKQLFGESEGKQNKGIFPAGAIFSTDLHSLGQYIQEGARIFFETFISVKDQGQPLIIPEKQNDADNLNYLKGKDIGYVNNIAEKGTMLAHKEGDVPVLQIEINKIDEYNLGQLIYFFEFACAISGYMFEVNPFDQPGVEVYKKNMFELLDKPGA